MKNKIIEPLSIEELSHLEELTIKGEHENLYDFLDKNKIKFNSDPMIKEGYCLREQGEELLNYVFEIEDKEKAKKTNEVLRTFGASRYRGQHYTEPDLVIPIQIAQAPWN